MITVFSVPKKFEGKYGIIQENAIRSWLGAVPEGEIILLGMEKGVDSICRKYGLIHVPKISKNKYGTPLLDSIFDHARRNASFPNMLYINSDIILATPVNPVVKALMKRFTSYIASGRRHELTVEGPVDFPRERRMRSLAAKCTDRNLKGPAWMDYFIFSRNLLTDIPPFALGRTFWDKWLIWKAHASGAPIIDITASLLAIHQSHGYTYNGKDASWVWEGDEAQENVRLAGGWGHSMTLEFADWEYGGRIFKSKKKNGIALFSQIKQKVGGVQFLWPLLLKIRRFRNRVW